MRKSLVILCMILGMMVLAGCDGGVEFLLGEESNFHPEGGPYQYVLSQAVMDAAGDFDFAKYRDRSVYVSVAGPTEYTQALAEDAIGNRLTLEKARVLARLTEEQKRQGLMEEKGHYELAFTLPVCGVHSFDGLVRRNITGLALFSLRETDADGNVTTQTGLLHHKPYKGWAFSPYFIVAFLAMCIIAATFFISRAMGTPPARTGRQGLPEVSAGQ